MSIFLIISLVALGLLSGFAAGLLGIGGGGIMVPLLTIIFSVVGFSNALVVHMAIATSLAVILFTAVSSVLAHNRRGGVMWPAAFWLVPGIVLGSWIGPMIAAHLNSNVLAAIFALFAVFSGYKMMRGKKGSGGTEDDSQFCPRSAVLPAGGVGIGIFSGLVGVGGGAITVPFLSWRGAPIHKAIGTSATMGFPIAVFGAASYIYQGWGMSALPASSLGFVYLPALVCVATASVLAAPAGARLSHSLDVKQLKTVFAWFLFVLAAYMFWKAATL